MKLLPFVTAVEMFGGVWGGEHIGEGLGNTGVDRNVRLFRLNDENLKLVLSDKNVDFAANGEVVISCGDIDRFLARCIEGCVVEICEFE